MQNYHELYPASQEKYNNLINFGSSDGSAAIKVI